MKVLIVDDTSFNIMSLQLILATSHFIIIDKAENGKLAIEKI